MRRRLLALAVPFAVALGSACKAPPRPVGDEAPVPALDPAALDRSVPPCEDFYAFACGGWIAATPVPPDRLSFRRGTGELEERNARSLRRILEDARSGKVDPRDRLARKAGDFYAACMDEAGVDARGLADLLAEWAGIDAVRDRGGLVAEVARQQAMGLQAPFALDTASPGGGGARTGLVLGQGGLTLPDRALYLDATAEPVRVLYEEHVRAMLELAGLPGPEAQAEARAVIGLERALAEPQLSAAQLRDPARAPTRVDAVELRQLAPGFPWTLFFEGVGYARVSELTVTTSAFVTRVGELFEQAPLETWKAYLRWRVTDAMAAARALPARMVDERFRFRVAAFGGPPAQRPRWKDCVAATERALGPAVGEMFTRRHLGAERDRAAHLAAEVQRALDADLRGLPWMDEPTRARAREKLGRLSVRLGGPEATRDDGALRVGRDSYFRNVLSAGRLELKLRLEQVGRSAEREWTVSPFSVHLVYDPARNALLLPAGALQPPFFEGDVPDELRYGAGGAALGATLVQVLDAGTTRRDGEGGRREWWTARTAERFDAVAACLARESVDVPPGAEASAAALEELADRGGVRLAWEALQVARAGKPPARKVQGLNPDQQFFVAFAQSRCTARREDDRTEGRPVRARVNGALSSVREFAAAFACKEGTPMARPASMRCGEW